MDQPMTVTERAADEMDVLAGGSTMALGADGWEAADFVDPDDDWELQSDGSYRSPDGSLRTWLAAGPEPV